MQYNVVKEYDWTSVPRGSELRAKSPQVQLKSYKIKSNQTLNRFKNYLTAMSITSSKKFYEEMYGNTQQEDIFFLPYFEDSVRSISNSFSDSYQGAAAKELTETVATGSTIGFGDGVTKFREQKNNNATTTDALKSAFEQTVNTIKGGGAPGSYVEVPKSYDYSASGTEDAINVTFSLSNTLNSDYMKNYELVKKLITINKMTRDNSLNVTPARIYRARIPGYRYLPWAYCSSFGVELVGTRRMIGKIIIPEGYRIRMSLTSLTSEVSNFMEEV
jgi:hypothetical protein